MFQADNSVTSSRQFTRVPPEFFASKRILKTNKRLAFHEITLCSKSPNNTGDRKVRENAITPSIQKCFVEIQSV
jgi:hypothetical protein